MKRKLIAILLAALACTAAPIASASERGAFVPAVYTSSSDYSVALAGHRHRRHSRHRHHHHRSHRHHHHHHRSHGHYHHHHHRSYPYYNRYYRDYRSYHLSIPGFGSFYYRG